MWSTFSDRERAASAIQERKLTPVQERAKAERECCWNAGYDAMVYQIQDAHLPVAFTSHAYIEARKRRFERWDLDRRTDAELAKALTTEARP